jgi:hypothetical protein
MNLLPSLFSGIVLPTEFLDTEFFQVLASFVALNTLIYVAVAIGSMLPKVYVSDFVHGRNRRKETRSIYPDGAI